MIDAMIIHEIVTHRMYRPCVIGAMIRHEIFTHRMYRPCVIGAMLRHLLLLPFQYRQAFCFQPYGGTSGGFRAGSGVHDSYTFQCGLVGYFISPGIDTRLKGPTAFSVSSERHWQRGVNGIAKVSKRKMLPK